MTRIHPKSAFSLVELLVVIAIISVLAAMLLPTLTDALEQGRRTVCLNNMKQTYLASVQYAMDFRDRLPPSGYKNGGDGRDMAGFMSMGTGPRIAAAVWVMHYAGVSLSDGTAPLSDVVAYCRAGNTPQYLNAPGARGMLDCPGNSLKPSQWVGGIAIMHASIWPTGFGGSIYDGDPLSSSRLSKVGVPSGGYPKILFMENIWVQRINDHRAFLYDHATGHAPGNPLGGNIIIGDGSGKWIPRSEMASFGFRGMPNGYHTLTCATGIGATPYVYYRSPAGAVLTYFKNSSPTQYNAAIRLWY